MKRRSIGTVAAGLLAAVSLGTWGAPATVAAKPHVARDPAVVVRWNEITERTLTESGQPLPNLIVYYGFTALAMYDAVVTIEGRYEPWSQLRRAKRHASPQVAAATAAYRVLRHYFPASTAALTKDYEAALAAVPNGVGKEHGIRVGRDAAAALIARRVDDGRGAAVPDPQNDPLEPGEWRPTPPATAMVGTSVGFVDPLLIPSPTYFPLDGPPDLDSAQYTEEFEEVRDYGRADPLSSRTPEQTATALFHTVAQRFQHVTAIRDQITDRHLDIVDSARALAQFMGSLADVSIACWRGKYDFKFWRPVTAIALANTDGNDDTDVVPGWAPLRPAPAYPDYVSGHACFTGSVSGSLDNLFGAGQLTPNYTMPSYAPVPGVPARSYANTDALDTETMNARIWNGFHFRTAMADGNALGHKVADYVATHHFQPTD